jgi:hypothetical protein
MDGNYSDESSELSTAHIFHNKKNPSLYHIQEKITMKTLSFMNETMKTLVQSKHLYQYPLQNTDYLNKADNIVELLNNDCNGKILTDNDLRNLLESIHEKMNVQDKIFLSELIYKFPSTILTVVNNEKAHAYPNLY